jgi:adenosylmethionine-8-amino-7-oxononanoate aminotransferase
MPDPSSTRLWHPFSNMAVVDGHEFVVDRAEGNYIWDDAGERYLDATSSLWCANVGHGHPAIIDAITAQLRQMDAYMTFGDYANPPAIELARRLAELAPVDDGRVFFGSGGGEAIDTAAKIIRRYWSLAGRPERMTLLGRQGGYHGTNGYGTSIGGIEPNRAGFGPLMAGTGLVEPNSVDALEAEILRLGPEHVAAFFCEPVLGAGGVHPPQPGYIEGVADVCERYGVLFVADAVICGFGRLGTWFGVERFGVRPDLITFAKGVTGGYLPLGGVVVSGTVSEPFWTGAGTLLRHGPTYAGHATCCAAGLATLDVLATDGLLERGQELEDHFADSLASLVDHELVSEVRAGLGLLAAVELDQAALAADATLVARLMADIRRAGVLVRPLFTSLAISPPVTVTHGELDTIAETVAGALERELRTA